MFQPRPKQQEVLSYTAGKMGVAAVPGSGKTQILACLAAQLVAEGGLADDQEVLIVTLVNSAVDNFARRVAEFVQARGLLPGVGYRVRTLYGLAHDIMRERPGLVGLSDDFQIVDERTAAEILADAAQAWLSAHPSAADDWLAPDLDERTQNRVRREHWPRLVSEIAASFIRQAKDLQVTPADLRQNLDALPEPLPLLEMGWAIYADYQRGLAYRGAVDYDDLIRLALRALQLDGEYLKRLRHRWPFILEDEAQDSSELQEKILRLLVGSEDSPSADLATGSGQALATQSAPALSKGPGRGWVRVGDPNQAIYETFTTASPRFLREFLAEPGVIARELPNSGRSTQSIMDLANYLVDWTRARHPVAACRDALTPTRILPTPAGDPQPNPEDDPTAVRLIAQKYTPAEELDAVVTSLARWLPANPDKTVAVLVPRNDRGEAVVTALKARGLECVELLRSTRATREAAGALGNIVHYLADPASPVKLATAYKVWRRADREEEEAKARLERVVRALRRCRQVEDFVWPRHLDVRDWPRGISPLLTGSSSITPVPRGWPRHGTVDDVRGWPRAGRDPLAGLDLVAEDDPLIAEQVAQFRELIRRWQGAALLPIDQLILTIAQDLFDRPTDLAVAHKLAVVLRQVSQVHPDWRLPELTQELAMVARNERKFLGFSDEDTGFDPERHRGKVVVATAHKAKGLEWDRVYLMSVNNYDYPSALPGDTFISERWFVRDGLNLEAETLAQLRGLFSEEITAAYVPAGEATRQARLDYAAERLRLLYVGITRARRELIITWNTGRQPGAELQPAVPFIALQTWWEHSRGAGERRSNPKSEIRNPKCAIHLAHDAAHIAEPNPMPLPPDFQFSQASLQDYADCGRRFQLRYILGLAWPAVQAEPAAEHEEHVRQGEAFHRMAHQHTLGILDPVADRRLREADHLPDPLRGWWLSYLAWLPADLPVARYPEITLSAAVGGYRLIAKYDLIAVEPGRRAVIVDWKTSHIRPKSAWLAGRLQTRVYRYLLVRAGAHLNGGQPLRPEQVEMIYWFANYPEDPEHLPYDATQYQADAAHLSDLIVEIRLGQEAGQNVEADLPMTTEVRRCRFCPYRSLCDRGVEAGDMLEAVEEEWVEDEGERAGFDFEQIAEIAF